MAFNSGNEMSERNDEDASSSRATIGEDLAREILSTLREIKEGQSVIKRRLSRIEETVDAMKETRELEVKAMQEWRPQVSNDVKAIDEKLSSAEKR